MKVLFNQKYKKYFSNISWLMTERLLRMTVGLFVGVYVARYLGPDEFGLLSYVGSFVALFIPITHLGLNTIIVRDLVKFPDNKDMILGTVFCLKLLGWGLMMLFIILFLPFTNNNNETNTLVFIISGAVLFQAFSVIDFSFQAIVKSKYAVQAQSLQLVVSSLTKLLLIYIQAPLTWFAWVFLLDAVLLAFGLAINYFVRSGSILKWRFNLFLAKKLLSESWPLILSGGAIIIQAHVDQVMLNEMINSTAVGQYSVAMRLTDAFSFLPMIVCSSLAPAITKAKLHSDELFYKQLAKLYKVMFMLFLVVAVPLLFLASPIVILLFGEAYSEAGVLLQLLTVRLFFSNFGVARSVFITNENLLRYALLTAVAGTIINVSANWLLIPEFGSKGAIVATIISFAVTTFIIDFFYVKTRKNTTYMFKSMFNFWKLVNEQPFKK